MRIKYLGLAAVLFFTGSLSTLAALPSKASAVSASNWQAGRIIDDGLFTDASSMNVAQIQSFLNGINPNCDTNGTQPASDWGRPDLTHAQYAASQGWPAPPYICMKDYYEVPKTTPSAGVPANNYSGSIPAGAISAAQMIYNAAQQYRISPKVLLVTIRKESAGPLTTDQWPLQNQYLYAMGAHCPDSGPHNSANCDPNYAGFSIQIAESAALLRYYLDNMNQSWWPYKKVGNNTIQYSPDTSCGSSVVNIVNSATAALYTYTPYQPNAAALAAGYGTAPCGAYGNRNFWLYYNEWFGPTIINFQASYAGESGYPTFSPGQTAPAFFKYANTGSLPWYDDVSAPAYHTYAIHLATSNGMNRASPFSAAWPTNNRATGTFAHVYEADGTTLAANQHIAQPGQIVEFDFTLTAPSTYGYSQEFFQPIVEGSTMWNMGGVAWLGVNVEPLRFQASYAGQSTYPNLQKGQSTPAYFKFQNVGNQPWFDDISGPVYHTYPVHLASTEPINTPSPFSAAWPTNNRATGTFAHVYEADGTTLAANQHIAQPGQIVEFDFTLTASTNQASGSYRTYFQPLLEGSTLWNMGGEVWLGVNVQ